MSRQMVGILIDRLLDDEVLRVQFALDRIETLADLSLTGIELTPDEMDLFLYTDARVWFWSGGNMTEPH